MKQGITATLKAAQWTKENCIVIDVESTGLGANDTITEIAAIDPMTNKVIINTLVHPLSPVNKVAEKVSGISTQLALDEGVPFVECIMYLAEYADKHEKFITSFNRAFDVRMIEQTALRSTLNHSDLTYLFQQLITPQKTTCIMELANRYLHASLEWDEAESRFKRISLAKCLEITGIQRQGAAHRAMSDTIAAVDLLNFIAEGK